MRIVEIITPRQFNQMQKPLLRTIPYHYDSARDNKNQVIVVMPPEDFLRLTTDDSGSGIDYFRTHARKLSAYNQYTKAGKSNLMPFLRIDIHDFGSGITNGKVRSHEGRHRAAATMNAGGQWMRVSLDLRSDGTYEPEMARQDKQEHGRYRNSSPYYYTAVDLPTTIHPEFPGGKMVYTRNWKVEEPDNLARYRR